MRYLVRGTNWSVRVFAVAALGLGALPLAHCGDDAGSGGAGTTSGTTASVSTATATAASTTTGGQGGAGGMSNLEPITCDVAIIGGGVGGLHTAFRLAPMLGDQVCLFEKEAQLGGRIYDVPLDENDPSSPRFGTGARRVMEGQTVLLDLANELGLTLETPPTEADLVNARGLYGTSKEALVGAYAITPQGGDTETALYDELRFGPARAFVDDYPDLRSYIQDTVGNEEFAFLHDVSRFRADFEYPLDAGGYMDYLDEEWDVCCTPSYPVGGMSEFIRGMEAAAVADGARIFTSDPVAEIQRDGTAYRLITATHDVSAQRVIVAVPPVAMQHIDGDVAEDLKAQPQMQQIIGVEVVTVTQWWPNAWWSTIEDPGGVAPDNNVWRAWTTEHCLNFIEIPLEPYGVDQMATRSVYDDDANCVEFWKTLLANGGIAAVEEEIQRGLEHLFNDNLVTTPSSVVIPTPLKTHVQVWPAAWHWLAASSDFTNADIFGWATEPLQGEEVALVGEAYHPQRSGWSDGAYKSSINLLNTKYGFTLPGAAPAKGQPRSPGFRRVGASAK